jgi:hypothetical protein
VIWDYPKREDLGKGRKKIWTHSFEEIKITIDILVEENRRLCFWINHFHKTWIFFVI